MKRKLILFLSALLALSMFVCGCGRHKNPYNKRDTFDRKLLKEYDENLMSDNILLAVDCGGSGEIGGIYQMKGKIIFYKNHDIKMILDEHEEMEFTSGTVSDADYESLVSMIDMKKLYAVNVEPDMGVCDGDSSYIYLYDQNDQVIRTLGGYMPISKMFNGVYSEAYRIARNTIDTDVIYDWYEMMEEKMHTSHEAFYSAGYEDVYYDDIYNMYCLSMNSELPAIKKVNAMERFDNTTHLYEGTITDVSVYSFIYEDGAEGELAIGDYKGLIKLTYNGEVIFGE